MDRWPLSALMLLLHCKTGRGGPVQSQLPGLPKATLDTSLLYTLCNELRREFKREIRASQAEIQSSIQLNIAGIQAQLDTLISANSHNFHWLSDQEM